MTGTTNVPDELRLIGLGLRNLARELARLNVGQDRTARLGENGLRLEQLARLLTARALVDELNAAIPPAGTHTAGRRALGEAVIALAALEEELAP